MPQEIKTSYKLKFLPIGEQIDQLGRFMRSCKEATNFTFNHIKKVYDSFEVLEQPIELVCERCKEVIEQKYLDKSTGKKVCGRCFNYVWSINKLTLKDDFQKDLIEAYPELSPAHKGYYCGIIKLAVQMFKSWLSKVKDREKEIEQLMIAIQTMTNPLKQLELKKKLKFKQEGIKNLEFRGNIIYLGNAGMFDFESSSNIRKKVTERRTILSAKKQVKAIRKKKQMQKPIDVDDELREYFHGRPEVKDAISGKKPMEEHYYIGFTSPCEKREKIWYLLMLGNNEDYKTEHNKIKLVEDCIEGKRDYKSVFGKILKNEDGSYEFMFPKTDISTSMTSKKEIEDFVKKHPENPIISLSFGIRRPITLLAFQNGNIKEIKSFGSPKFWHRINRERAYRAKMMRLFSKRYKKWHKNRARKAFDDKRGDSERRFIMRYCHNLTRAVVKHIKKQYNNAIVVMQDTKGIKRISYPKIYQVPLSRWSVEMQKTFLEYKEMLKNLHVYMVPYRESNNLTCSKCGAVQKDGKKEIKSLTVKLIHGSDRLSWLRGRANMLQAKINSLLKYPRNKQWDSWFRQTSEELTKVKQMLLQKQNGQMKSFKCQSCGYKQDFYTNDAIMLARHLIGMYSSTKTKDLNKSEKKKETKSRSTRLWTARRS